MKKTQTTEATAKRWKVLMILCVLCILGGIALAAVGIRQGNAEEHAAKIGVGLALFLVGGVGWFVVKFFRWWFHG